MMKLLIFLYKQELLWDNCKYEIQLFKSFKSIYYGRGMSIRKDGCASLERH